MSRRMEEGYQKGWGVLLYLPLLRYFKEFLKNNDFIARSARDTNKTHFLSFSTNYVYFAFYYLTRLPVNLPQLLVESRSLTVIVPEPSLFVKSASTKSLLISWSVRHHSSVLSVKSLRISSLIFVSNLLLSWPFKKLLRLTWSVFSRIPTCVPFTPSVLLSCPRIFNSPAEFVESAPKSREIIVAWFGEMELSLCIHNVCTRLQERRDQRVLVHVSHSEVP